VNMNTSFATRFSPDFFLEFAEHVVATRKTSSSLQLLNRGGEVLFEIYDPAVFFAIEQIAAGGVHENALLSLIDGLSMGWTLLSVHSCLRQLSQQRLLWRSVIGEHGREATFVPTSRYCEFYVRPLAEKPYVLSRFAYIRRVDDSLVCESPAAHGYVVLRTSFAHSLIFNLSKPMLVTHKRSTHYVDLHLLIMLVAAGLAHCEGEDELSSPSLKFWEFHDLLFHVRSRGDRTLSVGGGTYRFVDNTPPPPALEPLTGLTPEVKLAALTIEQLIAKDPPFAEVQERRRSQRKFGGAAISLDQLGEFLFRVARIKKTVSDCLVPTPQGAIRMDFALRPYPSGGALYEIDFYVAINQCQGISQGVYKYDGVNHSLRFVEKLTGEANQLLLKSAWATGIPAESIQTLIILSARFSRMQWKYETACYAAILKNVGVIFQTMYLAASAMGLSSCANGQGESECFSRVIGKNYYFESSVGEFLLGSASAPKKQTP